MSSIVRFKELIDPPGGLALPFEYKDPISFDLVSDPMVVEVVTDGGDSDGNPITGSRSLEYSKSLFSGEIIEESV